MGRAGRARHAAREEPEAARRVPVEQGPAVRRVEEDGERRHAPSPLPWIFEVVVGTGRRISAVCGLRGEDLELEPAPGRPHGAIVWREDLDKMGVRPVALPDLATGPRRAG